MSNPGTKEDSKFLPFWATPQYAGGLMQGLGVAFASLFLLNAFSSDFFGRYSGPIGFVGFVLIVAGGLRARKVVS